MKIKENAIITIDKIECNIAHIEIETDNHLDYQDIKLSVLEKDNGEVKEGDIFIFKDNSFIRNINEEKNRIDRINKLFQKNLNRSKSKQ